MYINIAPMITTCLLPMVTMCLLSMVALCLKCTITMCLLPKVTLYLLRTITMCLLPTVNSCLLPTYSYHLFGSTKNPLKGRRLRKYDNVNNFWLKTQPNAMCFDVIRYWCDSGKSSEGVGVYAERWHIMCTTDWLRCHYNNNLCASNFWIVFVHMNIRHFQSGNIRRQWLMETK